MLYCIPLYVILVSLVHSTWMTFGLLSVFPIMNRAAVNILAHIFWYPCVIVALGGEFLSHSVETCLYYQDNFKSFSEVDISIHKFILP